LTLVESQISSNKQKELVDLVAFGDIALLKVKFADPAVEAAVEVLLLEAGIQLVELCEKLFSEVREVGHHLAREL